MILKDQITNIFVEVDDFCKEFEQHIKQMKIEALPDGVKIRNRQVEHTRHRSVNNFIMNILGSLAAYCFFPKKPSLNLQKVNDGQLFLNFA